MNFFLNIFSPVLHFFYAIIVLWYVSLLICEFRRFVVFMPFFLWGIFICARAALLYYDLGRTFWWFVMDLGLFASYALILLALIRLTLSKTRP